MSDGAAQRIAVGGKVRIHFHPPGSIRSFCEGIVRRVDVTTTVGRFFVVEVTHEVILSQEHRVRPGFQDYVRYESQNDFPCRIEVLSAIEENIGEPALETGAVPEPLQVAEREQPTDSALASQQRSSWFRRRFGARERK
jgi:hypothetical protein